MSTKIVISASFLPNANKFVGLGVEMGVSGSHEKYNVFYNGECNREFFETEENAKNKAKESYNKSILESEKV